MQNRLCEMLGIEFPIFAFTHCRDVAAAVSRAGGMGVLGALAFTPDQLEIELNWIDEHVDGKPYGVDVVMPVKSADRDAGPARRQELVQEPERHDQPGALGLRREDPRRPRRTPAARGRVGQRQPSERGDSRLDRGHRLAIDRHRARAPDQAARQRARPAAEERDRSSARAGREGRRADRPRRAGGARRAAGRRHHHRPGLRGRRPHRRCRWHGARPRRRRRGGAGSGARGRWHRQRSADGRRDGARRRGRVDRVDLAHHHRVGFRAAGAREAARGEVDRHRAVAR